MSSDQVAGQAVAQRRHRGGQCGPSDGHASHGNTCHDDDAGHAGHQPHCAARPESIAEHPAGKQGREQGCHAVGDGTDGRGRHRRCPGKQQKGNGGIDHADGKQHRPSPGQQAAGMVDERQQHGGTEYQSDLDQRQRSELGCGNAHEQKRPAPDGAEQGQLGYYAEFAGGRKAGSGSHGRRRCFLKVSRERQARAVYPYRQESGPK